jgi:excisionase family DNA binding protein
MASFPLLCNDGRHPGKGRPEAKGGLLMMPVEGADDDRLLTPSEVAEIFRVNPKTVTRWARTGRLRAIKTIGGHRRYWLSEVKKAVLAANAEPERPAASTGERGA